jgi:cytochrome c553
MPTTTTRCFSTRGLQCSGDSAFAWQAGLYIQSREIAGALHNGKTMALTLNIGSAQRTARGRLSTHLARHAAVLIVACSASAIAGGAAAADLSQKAVRAKMDYCETCHGVSARGFVGFFPIPRLAGQPVEYIENELKGFVEHKRADKTSPTATNVMFNVGHVLSSEMIKALATNFNKLDPAPMDGAPKTNLAMGKKIFEEGVPGSKVPACATCHGPDAKGNGPIPRLAGQLYPYVVKQLTNWSHERAEENSDIMAPIVHGLTESQIDAVAAYVSYLK